MVRARVQASREDQNDLINEVLMSILGNLRRGMFDPEKGQLGSYLWGIARNKIRDFFKRVAQDRQHDAIAEDLPDFHPDPFERQQKRRQLHNALQKLDEKYRIVLTLRYQEELEIEDIAGQLGLTHTQVYNQIHYGLRLLRENWRE